MKDVITQSQVAVEIDNEHKKVNTSLLYKSICLAWVLLTILVVATAFYERIGIRARVVLSLCWVSWSVIIIVGVNVKWRIAMMDWDKWLMHGLALMVTLAIGIMWLEGLVVTNQGLPAYWLIFFAIWILYYLPAISFFLYTSLLIIILGLIVDIASPAEGGLSPEKGIIWSEFVKVAIIYLGLVGAMSLGKHVLMREIERTVRRVVVLNHEKQDILQEQKKVYYNAYYDFLTGLYNRSMMENKIMQAIKIAQDDASNIAVLFIDLDNFKRINDTLGHRVGDYTLFTLATRLRNTLYDEWFKKHTQHNENKGFLARLSGDEFIIVIVDAEQTRIRHICRNLVRTCAQLYKIPDVKRADTPQLSVSIGAVHMRFYGDKIYNRRQDKKLIRKNLLRQSDKNMYVAKSKKNTYHFSES